MYSLLPDLNTILKDKSVYFIKILWTKIIKEWAIEIVNKNSQNKGKYNHLNAYSLTGIGIGSLIGAGFFLGTSLALNKAGPSVVFAFLLGGVIMSQVLGAMTSIGINRSSHRTFRYFSEEMLGPYIGTLLGWSVFISSILTVCSEAIASGVFLSYWFPNVPITVLAYIILLSIIVINAFGIKKVGLIESVMSFIKISALILFIILNAHFLFLNGVPVVPNPLSSFHAFFPKGVIGTLQSMLIVIFSYGGVSAIAMASSEVKEPKKDIPKASVMLTVGIVLLYSVSSAFIAFLVRWDLLNTNESPFVSALSKIGIKSASSVMNAIILIATISVMIASFYTSTRMLVSLSKVEKALTVFSKVTPHSFYRNSWAFVSAVMIIIVGVSYVIKGNLFNYLISACSYFTFLNWSVNLITYLAWRKRFAEEEVYRSPLMAGRIGAGAALLSILVLFAFSLTMKDFRIGFYVAFTILCMISLLYWCKKVRKTC